MLDPVSEQADMSPIFGVLFIEHSHYMLQQIVVQVDRSGHEFTFTNHQANMKSLSTLSWSEERRFYLLHSNHFAEVNYDM